jgi:DNA (cytosine-5)-methyltransferase 1
MKVLNPNYSLLREKNMKILNLYSGIGGNRKLWGDTHEITAVELDPKIAQIYQDFFPNDTMIVTDAHEYLLEHFEEYDFIWASPPCPSHSHIRKELGVQAKGQNKPIYPDMKLYEEILLLQGYFKGKWVVENVISWYMPLIKPREINKHYFWANFPIREIAKQSRNHNGMIKQLEDRKGFNLDKYVGIDKRRILRNCVEPELGLHILNEALEVKEVLSQQFSLI